MSRIRFIGALGFATILVLSASSCKKENPPAANDAPAAPAATADAPAAPAAAADAPAAPAPAADAPADPAAAKPTAPKEFSPAQLADNPVVKLEDLGLDIDYIMNDHLYLDDNQKLEIGPGVTIDMQSSSAGIDVRGDAALIVRGTETSPVIMKSTNSSTWEGLSFESSNKDNALNYLQILNADGEDDAVIRVHDRLGMDHVSLDGSAGNGISVHGEGRFTRFTNNTIKNCKGFPLIIDNNATLEKIGEGNLYENNRQFIRLNNMSFEPKPDMVIAKQPIPYYLADGMRVEGETGTFSIQPGTEFAVEHEHEVTFWGSIQYKIEGTPENPVKFYGIADEANFWSGMNIESERPNVIQGIELNNTGNGDTPSIDIRGASNVTLSNISIKKCPEIGISISRDAKVVSKGGLVFDGCSAGNIRDGRIDGEDDKQIVADLPVTP